jgi:DTW domain-containing protein YfiP
MSKHTGDVDAPPARQYRSGRRLAGPAVIFKPVARIGRDKRRHYCERCGQKRRACTCPP